MELPRPIELSRPDRPWEFLSAVGERAGLFGNETGKIEAWVYPLKILRDFHLRFLVEGHAIPAETLARTFTVRPESSTILYTGDTFSVRETLFVPVHESGAVIIFEVETADPLDVQVEFERDFQLEWPAGLGGTYAYWDPKMSAFYFGEEQKKFSAFVGSPSASEIQQEYDTNYSSAKESSFHLGATSKGKSTRVVVIAASMNGQAEAEATYHHLAGDYVALMKESADYYRAYLGNTVGIDLPDRQLQQAYDWARVSVLQGLATNPFLGTGLIAGYRTSGGSQRPGFAWFFGRDALWTSLALDAEGDFASTRVALDFVSKYQRADTTVLYFYNFHSNGSGLSPALLLHNPIKGLKMYLFALGDVLGFQVNFGQQGNIGILALGAVIFIVAIAVVIIYGFHRNVGGLRPIGLSLICVGLLFDAMITEGRLIFGYVGASGSRYTTMDLLVPIGIYVTFIRPPEIRNTRQSGSG